MADVYAGTVTEQLMARVIWDEFHNLVPSCQPCNTARSNRWVRKRRREAAAR